MASGEDLGESLVLEVVRLVSSCLVVVLVAVNSILQLESGVRSSCVNCVLEGIALVI